MYTPHTWATGELIDADKLNALEAAAAAALPAADAAAVATSGAYGDLSGTPTIPSQYTDNAAVAAVQAAASVSPTGAWNFTQAPTVGGNPIGGGSTVSSTEADYVVSISGSTITATPRTGSGLSTHTGTDAYTVIQACINDLTPAGAIGSGGGRIHIQRGSYSLSDELKIVGWEGTANNQQSQLVIEGDGYNTLLRQLTSGKNGLIVSNGACFGLRNLQIATGSAAKACLRLDKGGATTEESCNRSFIDNVLFNGTSTTDPAGYFQNFFELTIPYARFVNTNNHALVLENSSSTTNYGNSAFGQISCYASTASPFAGLVARTTNSTHVLDMIAVQYFYCTAGYYGLFTQGLQGSSFQLVDIEYIGHPIWFDGGASLVDTRMVSILSGYLLPNTGGTAITCTQYTGGNSFDVYIETNGDSTVRPVSDASQYRPVNRYQLIYPTPAAANSITNAGTVFSADNMSGSGPGQVFLPTVTDYTTNGVYTYPIPTGATTLEFHAVGAGGGGAGGTRTASGTAKTGGGGGAGGAYAWRSVSVADLGGRTALKVTVGAAGTAGPAATADSTAGTSGGLGAATQIQTSDTQLNLLKALGGNGGNATGNGGAGGAGMYVGSNGGTSSSTAAAAAGAIAAGGAAGAGGGGGISATPAALAAGGAGTSSLDNRTAGTAGLSAAEPGLGGAGGAASITAAASAGTAGGWPGGGGGGGGSALNGFAAGAGAAGADGGVRIIAR